jgi:hypothetical protein
MAGKRTLIIDDEADNASIGYTKKAEGGTIGFTFFVGHPVPTVPEAPLSPGTVIAEPMAM